MDGLHQDEYGNIFYEILDTSGAKHTITLNYSSRPSRHAGSGKLESIKSECEAVKEKVICNIKENVEERSQKCSIVEFSSAFHMIRKIGEESQIKYIKQLYEIYGNEYVHKLENCDGIEDYTITLKYLPKLQCTEKDLIAEFQSLWPILNKTWLMKFRDSKPKSTQTK